MMDTLRFLDILGFAVGLVYLWLEYRASIWLWLASIVMPAIDMVLYFKAGLYADTGMAVYYCLAAVYGYWKWSGFSPTPNSSSSTPDIPSGNPDNPPGTPNSSSAPPEKRSPEISHFPLRLILPALAALVAIWLVIWWLLSTQTNSTVPVTDAFTTALSIVALWALARKYAEQWLLWLVVDAICCALYVYKGIPFKAAIYGIYTVFAVFGYRKWLSLCRT